MCTHHIQRWQEKMEKADSKAEKIADTIAGFNTFNVKFSIKFEKLLYKIFVTKVIVITGG